ncbi:AraC family transcriptional regulator [Paenibacillus sp. J2TS4]|uniref:AraC family transcriptional regulator n=1 Tax=Paenibacillus sp. J2TS4 TaxID=2807194 RepID=UPI001B16BCC5|nr:AraC family transcriptional regulator [Paenibacillus sp. J2TS4]GIP33210.1 transcriptional regulator [Paenibacillus sp. J2TS4]
MLKPDKQLARLRNVMANVQVQLSLAAYTKVNKKWRQMNVVPDFNRFYYICEGEGCLIINGQTYYPEPGQLFIMPSGVQQSYSTISEHTFGKYWCHFTAHLGDLNLFQLLGLPHYIEVKDPARLTGLFELLIQHYESSRFTALMMQKAVLLEMISLFVEASLEGKYVLEPISEDHRMHKVHTVLKYIEQHCHENITVQDMADLVHFHPNYFIRHFHEMVGTSPIQYIQQFKMEKAKALLSATDEPVAEIARSLGMEPYYFSRLFKKHTGLPPSGYRELFQRDSL